MMRAVRYIKIGSLVAVFLCSIVTSALLPVSTASAATGKEFRSGRIIDDAIFYNPAGMSAAQIQAFLNAKVPVCDTNGTQPSNHWFNGGNRYYTQAEWGVINGAPAPYTCLKDYVQSVPAMSSDTYCPGATSAGTKTAAQIIADVAQACSINPKVLLVLLQKEQGIVTDSWPWPRQYEAATGYACPDTASCDPSFAGFFKQVYYGARQYQRYAKEPQNFNFRSGRQSNVSYNPSPSCGSSPVYILNQATAGLYNYTPYQPNQAALNNLYGTGDSCSAYGNRNFWRMFSDWFGVPYANCVLPSGTGSEVYRIVQLNTNNDMLTSDPYEVCAATANYGFSYDGILLSSVSGGAPIFRLVNGGHYLYTASSIERDTAVSSFGFTYEGIAFLGSATPTSGAPLAVYRLSNANGSYYYTTSTVERDQAMQTGFTYEGIAFYTANSGATAIGAIYRLSSASGGYLYTGSDAERDAASLGYGFSVEGPAFSAYAGFSNDTLPVYRLAGSRGYLYTASLAERRAATAVGYRAEGVGFFAAGSGTSGSTPVYRLASPQGIYLYTTSTVERDAAVAQYGYRLEGIGFYLP